MSICSNKLFIIFIRLLQELKIIDQKKYVVLQSAIQEIGRMFGGWLKTLMPPKPF